MLCIKIKLIINIDEVSFNRKLVNNFSWLPILQTTPILNIEALGRWRMITGIVSNCKHISMLYSSKIPSNNFLQFLSWIKHRSTANKSV